MASPPSALRVSNTNGLPRLEPMIGATGVIEIEVRVVLEDPRGFALRAEPLPLVVNLEWTGGMLSHMGVASQ